MRECSTPEELLALAREEGVELTEEQLEDVSGGNIAAIGEASALSCGSGIAWPVLFRIYRGGTRGGCLKMNQKGYSPLVHRS